ncbi:GlsB/YeaQ/YmgE family stress response membrane protein [Mesobaculum littorinae]|uniref:GlsB/YeaQ/YmgE family stress response membrane protein n=1 Tax=Mesobaculum littorinae TaxID=2486419 RepID=A0A438AGK8_9RHOB|nr:GlsB/YeaQ/YmgE family stress response membrane protein [Mesobaculum littorinae]RVV97755.1 GlsB/YeaQ/YmgE family stress response membrane protein [Mesobaculum littorinae]
MEDVLGALGIFALVVMALVGAVVGWIASVVAGGHRARLVALGVLGAVALPFVAAALGLGVIVGGGLLVLLLAAFLGAVALLILVRLIFR